jgi:hypothetical protein
MSGGAARVTAVIAAGAASYLAALLAFGLAPEERDGLRRFAARLGLGRLAGRRAGGESNR